MNYFSHGCRFLDAPYFLAGTAVPDWLSIVDRKVRARARAARLFVEHDDPHVAAIARGIVQHHHDDDWFHQTRAFAELCLQFTVAIRDLLAPDPSMRPSFLGHILVELLLDDALIRDAPVRLDAYYEAVRATSPETIARAVAMIARPVDRLAAWIPRFCAERFLYDYAEDGKLLGRLNMIMRRVGLPALPESLVALLPEFRRQVAARRDELLPPRDFVLDASLTRPFRD